MPGWRAPAARLFAWLTRHPCADGDARNGSYPADGVTRLLHGAASGNRPDYLNPLTANAHHFIE
jgi:hypothetical protein